MVTDLLSRVSGDEVFLWLFLLAGVVAGTLIAVVGIVASQWRKYRQFQMEVALKEEMVARGLSVIEIERVLRATASPAMRDHAVSVDADAVDVVVEQDGDWYPATILKRSGDVFYIHYDGYDSSDDEWVPLARVRFRAAPVGAAAGVETISVGT